jgi:hypothetical protein
VLRALVRIAIKGAGAFKASTVRLDGKPWTIAPSIDFECPLTGVLKFSYNSFTSSKISANHKVCWTLEELRARARARA